MQKQEGVESKHCLITYSGATLELVAGPITVVTEVPAVVLLQAPSSVIIAWPPFRRLLYFSDTSFAIVLSLSRSRSTSAGFSKLVAFRERKSLVNGQDETKSRASLGGPKNAI